MTLGQHPYVQVFDYNLSNKKFRRLDEITSFNGVADVAVENMAVSPNGQYAALLLNSDTSDYRTDVTLLDMKNNEKLLLSSLLQHTDIENVRTNYWNEQELYFTVQTNGQLIRYKWDAVSKSLETL